MVLTGRPGTDLLAPSQGLRGIDDTVRGPHHAYG
jgi:hypothetical protein